MNRQTTALMLLPLGALALLSACNRKPDGELTAGQWKSTMQMTKFDVPGAPPEMQAQLKSMIGRSQSAESCMSEAEAKKGVRDFSKSAQSGGDCQLNDYKQGGGSAYHEVVLTVETDLVDQEVTLGNTDDGWKLRLLADGVEQPLVTVYKVREPNPLHHGLYAYLNLWNELWIARFQKVTTSPTELVLKVGSGFGHGEVHWTGAQLSAPAP